MPCKYDKWTVPRVLLAVSVGEKAAEVARARLLREGQSESVAAAESARIGLKEQTEVMEYWLALIPEHKTVPIRYMSALKVHLGIE